MSAAEQQRVEGWYCYACARWLRPNEGVVRTARFKAYPGLYCKRCLAARSPSRTERGEG